MFRWFYRKIWSSILTEAQDWLESKEGRIYINDIADSVVNRQVQRIQGSAGGIMHNPSKGFDTQTLFGSIMQVILPKLLNNKSQQPLISDNPYATKN